MSPLAAELLALASRLPPPPTGGAEPSDWLRWVQETIYRQIHTRDTQPPRGAHAVRSHEGELASHRAQILGAIRATHGWERGWRFLMRDGRDLVVQGRGLHLWAQPDEVLIESGPAEPEPCQPGQAVLLRVPAVVLKLMRGFIGVRGQTPPPWVADARAPVRVYFHLRPEGAAAWVAMLSTALDAAQVPFLLKVLADPRDYSRTDAGVLYLERRELSRATPALQQTWRALRPHLRAAVSGFVQRVADGLGLAEDPGDFESFGGERSRRCAEALLATYTPAAMADWGTAALSQLSAQGLDLEHPERFDRLGPALELEVS